MVTPSIALSIGPIVLIVLGAFVVLIVVIVPALLLIVAMAEKNRVPSLSAAPPEKLATLSAAHQSVFADATTRQAFEALGIYQDSDVGIKQGLVSFLLSPDHVVLLWLQHSKLAPRLKLISQFAGDRWLITTDVYGARDLSGLNEEMMVPQAKLDELLERHRATLAARNETPIPFAPASAVEQVVQHERNRLARMVENGSAKYVSADQGVWKHTACGAMRVIGGYFGNVGSTVRQDHLRTPGVTPNR
jgi:hypothetical protein